MKNKKIIEKFIRYSEYRSYKEIVEFIDSIDKNYLYLCLKINKIDGLLYLLSKDFDYRQKIKCCANILIINRISDEKYNEKLSNIMFDLMLKHNYKKIPFYNDYNSYEKYNYYNDLYKIKIRENKIKKIHG